MSTVTLTDREILVSRFLPNNDEQLKEFKLTREFKSRLKKFVGMYLYLEKSIPRNDLVLLTNFEIPDITLESVYNTANYPIVTNSVIKKMFPNKKLNNKKDIMEITDAMEQKIQKELERLEVKHEAKRRFEERKAAESKRLAHEKVAKRYEAKRQTLDKTEELAKKYNLILRVTNYFGNYQHRDNIHKVDVCYLVADQEIRIGVLAWCFARNIWTYYFNDVPMTDEFEKPGTTEEIMLKFFNKIRKYENPDFVVDESVAC
ncbi:hypothetical protein NIES2100_05260 [Calothrix sp. NIES-2100]|uniref:hypothetical protein n=1 Tax=Calothrix sp. NIES-2100 TaxID=1954172 RepID=UPI000B5ED09B|nr:hypothetical protein NIES2100_05260 [Calothrix sp. NIES-2100]